MKEMIHIPSLFMATSISFWIGLAVLSGSVVIAESPAKPTQGQSDTTTQRKNTEQQARPEIEKQRQQQEQQGQQSVN
jgi:hypothetical protein